MVEATQGVESLETLYTNLKTATFKQQHAQVIDIVSKISP